MTFDSGEDEPIVRLVGEMLEQHFEDTADGDPDLGIYLNPNEAPGIVTIYGFPIERHKRVPPATAMLFDRKLMTEVRFKK